MSPRLVSDWGKSLAALSGEEAAGSSGRFRGRVVLDLGDRIAAVCRPATLATAFQPCLTDNQWALLVFSWGALGARTDRVLRLVRVGKNKNKKQTPWGAAALQTPRKRLPLGAPPDPPGGGLGGGSPPGITSSGGSGGREPPREKLKCFVFLSLLVTQAPLLSQFF